MQSCTTQKFIGSTPEDDEQEVFTSLYLALGCIDERQCFFNSGWQGMAQLGSCRS